jgi:signal transduction histidine kinase/Tfp pilus assembly protein PilF
LKRLATLIFILFSFFSLSLSAQNLDTDSLKKALPLATELDRLFILNELGTNLRENDQDLALEYLFEAEKIAIARADQKAESKSKENISWIYYRRGQWQRSFEYAVAAYRLALESSSFLEAARVLNNMGALYYEQQNYEMAILKFKEAYNLSLKSSDLYTQIRSLNNVAFNFAQLGELDSALTYAVKSIEANEKAGSPYLTSFTFRVIADIYFEKNQLDSAEALYKKSLDFAEKQDALTFKAGLYHRIGSTYLRQGKLIQAESILKEGILLSSENKFLDELQKTHKVLAEVYEAKGDIRAAFAEQSKYLTLNDSLQSKETKNRLSLLQGMFENDLKESEFELLKAQNENQATRLEFANRTVWVISVAGLLILGLGIWLFRLNKKAQKQNKDLAQKSKELAEINQTKNKLFSIIGHDLRGPVGQVKSIVDLLIRGYLDKEEFDELIQNLKKDVDSVYLTLNNTLKWSLAQMDGFKLNQKELDLNELIESSLIAVQTQLKEKNIHIDKSIRIQSKVLADLDLMEVVLRNIFNNSIKFSKPGQIVEVTAEQVDQKVILCIKDHGTGMSEKQIDQILSENISITDSSLGTHSEKGTGLGLQICKEFTKMNGGQLSITSELKNGTKVCLSFLIA